MTTRAYPRRAVHAALRDAANRALAFRPPSDIRAALKAVAAYADAELSADTPPQHHVEEQAES